MSIGVVIATIDRPSLDATLKTIYGQTRSADDVVTVWDHDRRGAPWARNLGASKLDTDWLVFSDDDVLWVPTAFELLSAIAGDEDIVYGSYEKNGQLHSTRQFDPKYLRRENYISTMSMVRASAFPGFDETLTRLQDWDLWLTMIERGSVGVHCGELIFRTHENGGISSRDDWAQAARAVKLKHGL